MDNSVLFGMESPIIDFSNMPKYEKRWSNGCNWRKFDQITSNKDRIDGLVDEMISTKHLSSDLLVDPSLEECTVRVCEVLRPENTFVCYKKTIMKSEDFIPPESGDCLIEYMPVLDAYVFINNGGSRCDMVVNIGRMQISHGKNKMSSTYAIPMWTTDCPESYVKYAPIEELYEFARAFKLTYMAIQYALLHRPTRFVVSGPAIPDSTVGNEKPRHHKHNKCKAIEVRYLRIIDDPAPVRDENADRRTMSCPCWGVIGHMRHYKSGKAVWIKPYRKGKERKNPEKYQPKDYEIPERRPSDEQIIQ